MDTAEVSVHRLTPERLFPQTWARRHLPFTLVFVLLGVLYFSTIRPGHDWGGDFAVYVWQARNLATGAPLNANTYLLTEDAARGHPEVYPPLTAVILAPVYAVTGLDYVAFKAVLTVFLWLSLPIYYLLAMNRGLPEFAGAVTASVFGLTPVVLAFKQSVGSDMVFLFVAGGTLLFLDTLYRRKWDESRPVTAAFAAATLLLLCYLARATGLCLIVAFFTYEFLWCRCIRRFGIITVAIVGFAVILYTTFVFDAGQHYGNQFQIRPSRYLENLLYYLRSPAAFWGSTPAFIRYPLAAATLLLAVLGFARRLRKATVVELYVLVFIAVLIVYSSGTGVRYAVPLLPLVLIYAAEAFLRVAGSRRLVVAVCTAAVVAASALNLRHLETGPITEGVAQASFVELSRFLRENTPPDATVLSWNPRVFALYTGKTSAVYPMSSDPLSFESRLPDSSRHVLVVYNRHDGRDTLLAVVGRPRSTWNLVFRNSDFDVYERR